MTRLDIYKGFEDLFPDWVEKVESYKKVGSKTISLKMKNGRSLVFLYNNPNNWNFGTKPWRKKPEPIQKKEKQQADKGVG